MRPTRRALAFAVGAAGVLSGASEACTGETTPPLGNGNMVNVDVDASSMPAPDNGDAGLGADSPFAPLDGPYGSLGDVYAPIANCAQCGCDGGTYCYGGSPTSTLAACDQTASTGLDVGCHALPAACASAPDCVCLLESLPKGTSCYPVCSAPPTGGFVVYCPR